VGTLAALRGETIALDTAPFIYFIERHPKYHPWLRTFFESVEVKQITVVTTTLTLAEVLVKPLRLGRLDLVAEYTQILLNTPGIQVVPVSADIAEEAARIRAEINCKIPDAIQLATAVRLGAQSFLTNDLALSAYRSVQIIQLDRLAGVR
jgi:predicted nucleic acid-binding protein